MESPEFSAVIPCLDEAENAEAIARAVVGEFEKAGGGYEIVFIDNGSTDGTVAIIKSLCAANPRIRLIVNTRNFGQMRSPTHAIFQTTGRAVIGIAADFQDPPEMIGAFIERWRAGAMIVLGVRDTEKTSALLHVLRAVGYGFLSRFGDYRVIPGATGFGLYDGRVVETLKRWRDPEPFFRGMLVESGFPLETIPYHRPERAGGVTKNNLGTLLSFFLSGLSSSSKRLLRAPLVLSLFVFAIAGVLFLTAAISAIVGGGVWIPLLSAVFALFAGLNFLFLGIIGDQVRLIAQTVRGEPLVVEKERINFPATRA